MIKSITTNNNMRKAHWTFLTDLPIEILRNDLEDCGIFITHGIEKGDLFRIVTLYGEIAKSEKYSYYKNLYCKYASSKDLI